MGVRTKSVRIGSLTIGGRAVAIQSMTNTPTANRDATCEQIRALKDAGCDIVRLAFSSEEECALIPVYREAGVPLVADIQFDYRLAIAAAEYGIDKVRFNPGNIGDDGKVRAVLDCARAHGIPIRIGVNSGSLPRDLVERTDLSQAERLAEAAMRHVRLCERHGFDRLVLSVKSSDVPTAVAAYRELSAETDYPLHLGVTEAGSYESALVKSAAAFGALLIDGIGDTVRVSVTGDVTSEVRAARAILRAVGLDRNYCEIVSCPTCSRTKIDLFALERAVRTRYGALRVPLKLAVMGCVVNGPGEARDADFGIAGGDGRGILFRRGVVVDTVDETELLPRFYRMIDEYLEEKYGGDTARRNQ